MPRPLRIDLPGIPQHVAHYIELNPVRATMVADPRDYRWSSHRALAFGESDSLLTPHHDYLALSTDAAKRQLHYRAMVMTAIDAEEVDTIRLYLQRQHPYGPARFRLTIEAQLGRAVGLKKIGRPKKNRGQRTVSAADRGARKA